jgi:DNA-directed RNA polymerase specialized sigma24 family protein
VRSASGNEGLDGGFDEFAMAAWPRLRRSAYLLTGDHHLAEDLAQTALVRTYAHWRRVRRSDALAVAHELGIARGTVKSTLSRALGKLRVAASDGDRTYEEVVGQ